jgi:hypothetical protein
VVNQAALAQLGARVGRDQQHAVQHVEHALGLVDLAVDPLEVAAAPATGSGDWTPAPGTGRAAARTPAGRRPRRRGMTRFTRLRRSSSDCGAPPENGSSTSTPPRSLRRTRKWPGTTRPRAVDRMRRPSSIYRIDRVIGMPVLRSITSFR